MRPHRLPAPLQRRVESLAAELLSVPGLDVDFARPPGAPALVPADSVSWRIFRNPVTLYIGGVAAVLLELAEPRVRAGVWDHSTFRTDPVMRMRRTGLAAMVTVYAARETAEAMIAGVNRRHARVTGTTEHGQTYAADDRDLLDWVQATASFGFIEAYDRFGPGLSADERDRAWREGAGAARLYGALGAPTDEGGWRMAYDEMEPALEPSPVIAEFLDLARKARALPSAGRFAQPLLVSAAIDLLPIDLQIKLGLNGQGLTPWSRTVVRTLGRAADRLVIERAPWSQACIRMGLPADWLYRPRPGAEAA